MSKPKNYEEDEQDLSKERVKEINGFFAHVAAYVFVNIGMFFIDLVTGDGLTWFYYLLITMGIGLGIHGSIVFFGPRAHRLAKKLEAKESIQVQSPKTEGASQSITTKHKGSLGFDPARIGKDILRAIRELEGGVNDTALGTESPNSNQVSETTASAPAIPQGVAILMFTDIAGFTSYVEKNGDEAGHSLLKLHNHIIRTSVKNNDGIEIKNLGDGFMLCFVSAKKALQCAADIQEQLREAEYQLQVRVGIHAGEPIHEDKDLTGQTVNLAARVMDQANGGQIFVTEVIRNLAGNLNGFQYADQGERRLPGLSERYKIYEFVPIEALTSPLDTEVETQLSQMENQLGQDS